MARRIDGPPMMPDVARLAALTTLSGDGLLMLDRDGRVEWSSRRGRRRARVRVQRTGRPGRGSPRRSERSGAVAGVCRRPGRAPGRLAADPSPLPSPGWRPAVDGRERAEPSRRAHRSSADRAPARIDRPRWRRREHTSARGRAEVPDARRRLAGLDFHFAERSSCLREPDRRGAARLHACRSCWRSTARSRSWSSRIAAS